MGSREYGTPPPDEFRSFQVKKREVTSPVDNALTEIEMALDQVSIPDNMPESGQIPPEVSKIADMIVKIMKKMENPLQRKLLREDFLAGKAPRYFKNLVLERLDKNILQ